MLNPQQERIKKIKEEKNAIILAHNYQKKEIQEVADFLGDSLELCIKASEIEDKDIVVFCGVDFMAETAYILNPNKKILIPDVKAECPMAHMLSAEEIKDFKTKYPNSPVVLYVNSLAEAKAEADILCTSGNAKKIVESLDEDIILFGPDTNLANYVAKQTNKEVIPIPGNGHCYVHKMFNPGDIAFAKEEHPNAEVIVHPECDIEVQEASDKVESTGGMLSEIKKSEKKEFIVGTEIDFLTRVSNETDKKLYPLLETAICETMKFHNLDNLEKALLNEEHIVEVPEDIQKKSFNAVNRMIEVTKQ